MTSRALTVLGQKWRVRVIQKFRTKASGTLGKDYFAITIFDKNQIVIWAKLSEDAQRSALLHEILEILKYQLRILQPNSPHDKEIMRLEGGLFQVLHDNKLRF
jgi:hypothetical protein